MKQNCGRRKDQAAILWIIERDTKSNEEQTQTNTYRIFIQFFGNY